MLNMNKPKLLLGLPVLLFLLARSSVFAQEGCNAKSVTLSAIANNDCATAKISATTTGGSSPANQVQIYDNSVAGMNMPYKSNDGNYPCILFSGTLLHHQ